MVEDLNFFLGGALELYVHINSSISNWLLMLSLVEQEHVTSKSIPVYFKNCQETF